MPAVETLWSQTAASATAQRPSWKQGVRDKCSVHQYAKSNRDGEEVLVERDNLSLKKM